MTDRQAMLNRLSGAQFACYEMRLFLDTHPNDREAIAEACERCGRARELAEEYQEKYGDLTPSTDGYRWNWVDDPWPWEYRKGCN